MRDQTPPRYITTNDTSLFEDLGELVPMGHLDPDTLHKLLGVMPLVRWYEGTWAYFSSYHTEVLAITQPALKAS